jgi:tetratricopeptide (TPR) repeat protein
MKTALLLILSFSTGLLARAQSEPQTAPQLIARGDALDQQLKNSDALAAYLAAEKLCPTTGGLLYRIAKEYAEMMVDTDSVEKKRALGDQALDYAKRAVAIAPKDAQTQLGLAVCYGRLAPLLDNKTKIAYSRLVKMHAEVALALDPDNDLTYNVLGSWNYELANLSPFLRTIAGMIYGQLPDATFEESMKDFQKAIALNPNRLANHIGLGRACAAMGDIPEAKKEIGLGLSMPNKEKDDNFVKAQGRETLSKL